MLGSKFTQAQGGITDSIFCSNQGKGGPERVKRGLGLHFSLRLRLIAVWGMGERIEMFSSVEFLLSMYRPVFLMALRESGTNTA